MSVYAIGQWFGYDQFFAVKLDNPAAVHTTNYLVGGSMGHPTILAAFIVMIIPLAIYIKKYWMAAIMLVAVILTKSDIALGSLFASGIFYIGLRNKKTAIITAVSSAIIVALAVTAYINTPLKKYVSDSGRFAMWADVIADVNNPMHSTLTDTYPWTGFGIGSFKYIYPVKNANIWYQAHNEYLEILYNTGIIGLFLFMMGWIGLICGHRLFTDTFPKVLLTSFFCISVCAGGTFPWQLGAHAYYTITILGLLNQGEKSEHKSGDHESRTSRAWCFEYRLAN